jgi:hypothetical protein
MSDRDEHPSFFCARQLSEEQVARWRDLADQIPWAHYRQDPAWANMDPYGSGMSKREPWFFWGESGGALCLTAIGVRRRLPVPGYVFWEFNKGPSFVDGTVLNEWLPWVVSRVRRGAARMHMEPATPLDQGGDEIRTILERHGLVRCSDWATLLLDLTAEEDQIVAGFRSTTQQCIRKSRALGITVEPQDTPDGWRTIAALQADLSLRAPVLLVEESMIQKISRDWLREGSGGTVLVARHGEEALAAALIVTYRGTAHLVMMPSGHLNRDFPASHLLLWEAMRWSRQHGCSTFDLGGYSLEAQQGDSLWGVNLFKRGFAPLDRLSTSVGMYEMVLSPTIVALAARARRYQGLLSRRHDVGLRLRRRLGKMSSPCV